MISLRKDSVRFHKWFEKDGIINTSTKMIHRNYLDEDDVMMIEEYQKMYSKK